MKLDKRCFKIDKTNAKVMIVGYQKDGAINRQSIWCAVQDYPFPMLITLNRTRTKFPMSSVGERLFSDHYSIPYKYIATLDSEYFIRNDMGLWDVVCHNGLFDVWKPNAPYMRFDDSSSPRSKYRIQLIRIWQIREEFRQDEIKYASDRIDHLISWTNPVTPEKPVINEEDFRNIKLSLIDSVQKFITR
ncbi:MAG: hypothetical protein NTV58_04705 [Deltaproteobacteria bacterium]|nr:hypothetical protein [Deltaproteobacteria bacterium]